MAAEDLSWAVHGEVKARRRREGFRIPNTTTALSRWFCSRRIWRHRPGVGDSHGDDVCDGEPEWLKDAQIRDDGYGEDAAGAQLRTDAYHMTGRCGILAVVQVADIDELTKSIQEIQNVDDVLYVEARVALEKIK